MVDPLATPLAAWLAKSRHVTPNRVTAAAIAVRSVRRRASPPGVPRRRRALPAAVLRRLHGRQGRPRPGHELGARSLLDIAADVGGIALVTAALSWTLLRRDDVHELVPVALLGAMLFYNWALAYRKQLAGALGLGEGRSRPHPAGDVPVVRHWVAFCRRLNMSPVPWALEAEIAMLGLAPLLLPPAGSARVSRWAWLLPRGRRREHAPALATGPDDRRATRRRAA